MKKLFFLTLMVLCSTALFAQRRTVTKDYYKDSPLATAGTMGGKITYGYIVDADGYELKDGPLSIRVSTVNEKVYVAPYSVVLNGSYTVTTSFVKGNLNGPFSASYKLSASGSSIFGDEKGAMTATVSGAFSNGIPNGTFNVKSNTDFPASLTATYKNGKLVGAFSCSYLNSNGRVEAHKGTLTQSGEFTGTWTFLDAYTQTATFVNGVLISESRNGKSTKPAISELAKQYANGSITEQQLFERGCMVYEDSVDLGDCASDIILGHSYVDFERLGGYDFTMPNAVKYKYLKEMATLTDAGFNALVEAISSYVSTGSTNSLSYICSEYYGAGLKYSCIKTDANGRNYIYMHYTQNQGYASGGFGVEVYYDNVYISEAQMKRIDEEVESALIKQATTLEDCILDNKENNFYYNEHLHYERCKGYLENDKYKWNGRAERVLVNGADLTDKKSILKRDLKYKSETIKSLEIIEAVLSKLYKRFGEEHTKHATNEAIVIWKYEDQHGTNKHTYIHKASVDEFAAKIAQIGQEIAKLKTEHKALKEELKKLVEEEQIAKIKTKIEPALNHMKYNQKPLGICYGENTNYFYSSTNNEFWKSDLEKRIKPFCPIVDVEMVEVNTNSVLLNIKTTGKKKTVLTYQISVTHKDGRLCVESFDITKAKQL